MARLTATGEHLAAELLTLGRAEPKGGKVTKCPLNSGTLSTSSGRGGHNEGVIAGYIMTGAACLSVLAVVLFCQAAETGSAADWVTSVANAMMAITAVFAFIVAHS